MARRSSTTTPTGSGNPKRSGWTRHCSPVKARFAPSAGRRRSSTLNTADCSMSWRAGTQPSRAPGSQGAHPNGASGCGGRRWICRARIARCSTRCFPTPSRSLTHFTSSGWRTSRWMSAGAGCRTRPSATAAAVTIRSTAAAAGSSWPVNDSASTDVNASSVCSLRVTPSGRCGSRGTPIIRPLGAGPVVAVRAHLGSSRRRWVSRLVMTRWWRAVSEVQPRASESSRSWRMSSS